LQTLNRTCSGHIPKTAEDILASTFDVEYDNSSHEEVCIDSIAALSRWALHQHRINAGSILFSELSYCGWSFPLFVLTDSDERFLFDVEVSVFYCAIFVLIHGAGEGQNGSC
jgi:hypothetical protein